MGTYVFPACQFGHQSLCPPCNGACHVQMCCGGGATGKNKRGQGRDMFIKPIDFLFKPVDLFGNDAQGAFAFSSSAGITFGGAQIGAQIEPLSS